MWVWLRRALVLLMHPGGVPQHVALIMDGNRRFAAKEELNRLQGHTIGYAKMVDAIHWCLELGVRYITVYAFSIDNFSRSPDEVSGLMQLAEEKYMELMQADGLAERKGVEIRILGDLTLAPPGVQGSAARLMQATAALPSKNAVLNICFSYTASEELVHAVDILQTGVSSGALQAEEVSPQLLERCLHTQGCPPVDLLIRTSGETRLSDFMLWQASHAHLEWVDTLWPDWGFLSFARCITRWQQHQAALAVLQHAARQHVALIHQSPVCASQQFQIFRPTVNLPQPSVSALGTAQPQAAGEAVSHEAHVHSASCLMWEQPSKWTSHNTPASRVLSMCGQAGAVAWRYAAWALGSGTSHLSHHSSTSQGPGLIHGQQLPSALEPLHEHSLKPQTNHLTEHSLHRPTTSEHALDLPTTSERSTEQLTAPVCRQEHHIKTALCSKTDLHCDPPCFRLPPGLPRLQYLGSSGSSLTPSTTCSSPDRGSSGSVDLAPSSQLKLVDVGEETSVAQLCRAAYQSDSSTQADIQHQSDTLQPGISAGRSRDLATLVARSLAEMPLCYAQHDRGIPSHKQSLFGCEHATSRLQLAFAHLPLTAAFSPCSLSQSRPALPPLTATITSHHRSPHGPLQPPTQPLTATTPNHNPLQWPSEPLTVATSSLSPLQAHAQASHYRPDGPSAQRQCECKPPHSCAVPGSLSSQPHFDQQGGGQPMAGTVSSNKCIRAVIPFVSIQPGIGCVTQGGGRDLEPGSVMCQACNVACLLVREYDLRDEWVTDRVSWKS